MASPRQNPARVFTKSTEETKLESDHVRVAPPGAQKTTTADQKITTPIRKFSRHAKHATNVHEGSGLFEQYQKDQASNVDAKPQASPSFTPTGKQ